MQYRQFETVQSSKISPDDQKELYSFFMEYKRFPWYLVLLLFVPIVGFILFVGILIWNLICNFSVKQRINSYILNKNISNFDQQDFKRRLTAARMIPKVSIKGIIIGGILFVILAFVVWFTVVAVVITITTHAALHAAGNAIPPNDFFMILNYIGFK